MKGAFSILSGLVPLNFNIQYTTQIGKFLDYLSIKFGEYGHQGNCEAFTGQHTISTVLDRWHQTSVLDKWMRVDAQKISLIRFS